MSGNNSYGPWKPAVPMDVIASGNYSKRMDGKRDDSGHLLHEPGYGSGIASTSVPGIGVGSHMPLAAHTSVANEMMLASGQSTVPNMAHGGSISAQGISLQRPQIDIYSPMGMQRLGQLYKGAMFNNSNNKNNGGTSSVEMVKLEQSRNNIQHVVESAIGNDGKQQIMQILEKVALLQPPERLLLYLRLPCGTSETDPLRQPQNPLGTRSEINHTINWVRSHLEHDPSVSIPKQDVYDDYVSYCTREDIKPLSTADFGKVMKQIFPSIRPRRLGTRGNSRYCYAAMRKTTKLECPFLPNLNETSNVPATTVTFTDESDGDVDTAASWKIIKTWAEGLLSTKFESVKQMADFISTNYANANTAAAANSSRVLLQKKLLQRKVKGRKKSVTLANVETMQKKRRKKKLKTQPILPDSETQSDQMVNELPSANTHVPDASRPTKSEASPLSSSGMAGQQLLPMNLKTNENNNKIKCEQADVYSGDMTVPNYDDIDMASVVCKVEMHDGSDIEQNIYCKKVKRAQESKGLLNICPAMSSYISTPQPQLPLKDKTTSSLTSDASQMMQSPAYVHFQPPPMAQHPKDADGPSSLQHDTNSPAATTSGLTNKRSTNSFLMRNKKLRFLKNTAALSALNETKVDDVTTDIIIPRERVISICSLDKDALDGYLNEGDNSQEQEAELLQYFQHPTSEANDIPTKGGTVNTTQSTMPMMDNYQVYSNTQMGPPRQASKKEEQIIELRQYLQQNLQQQPGQAQQQSHAQPDMSLVGLVNKKDGSSIPVMQPMTPQRGAWNQTNAYANDTSASATLAMMSSTYSNSAIGVANKRTLLTNVGTKRKLSVQINQQQQQTVQSQKQIPMNSNNQQQSVHPLQSQHPPLMRSLSSSAAAQQSPNSRRKNFSFVPISPGPQSPRVFSHQQQSNMPIGMCTGTTTSQSFEGSSPFVSPRATPGIRKQIPKDLATSITSSLQTSDPLIGSLKTAFSKPNSVRSEISASAPTSPSMIHQQFHFNTGLAAAYSSANFSSAGPAAMPTMGPSHQVQANMCAQMMESRSQSVPLHCQSPAFNTPTAYSSACNSIAQTPVPSEFADFCDESILNILAETSADQSIKLEVNDIPDLLDLPDSMDMRSHHLLSRSVPSTPLPHGPYSNGSRTNHIIPINMANKMNFDMSKSVPTTPIAMSTPGDCTPFRYSPVQNRDFLINGNTIDVKGNLYHMNQQQQHQHQPPSNILNNNSTQDQTGLESRTLSMISNEMDELSNYSNVNDPIIDGSDLLSDL